MSRFTFGLFAGAVIGATGITWAMSDSKSRRRMMKDGRRAMRKANQMIDNVTDMF